MYYYGTTYQNGWWDENGETGKNAQFKLEEVFPIKKEIIIYE